MSKLQHCMILSDDSRRWHWFPSAPKRMLIWSRTFIIWVIWSCNLNWKYNNQKPLYNPNNHLLYRVYNEWKTTTTNKHNNSYRVLARINLNYFQHFSRVLFSLIPYLSWYKCGMQHIKQVAEVNKTHIHFFHIHFKCCFLINAISVCINI